MSTLSVKAGMIDRLLKFLQCDFDKLVYLWAKECHSNEHLRYRLDGLGHAVYGLSGQRRYAEEYLMHCRHPLLRRQARFLTQHWKMAVSSRISRPLEHEVTDHNLQLFLLRSGRGKP
jgi:hypothetical protein